MTPSLSLPRLSPDPVLDEKARFTPATARSYTFGDCLSTVLLPSELGDALSTANACALAAATLALAAAALTCNSAIVPGIVTTLDDPGDVTTRDDGIGVIITRPSSSLSP